MDVARRIANTDTSQCPVSEAAMACVDLTHQTFYITQNGSVLLGPTVTRTGMPGWATPSGTFPIANKAMREWSTPFSVWLPYWQRFYYGDGLQVGDMIGVDAALQLLVGIPPRAVGPPAEIERGEEAVVAALGDARAR